MTKRMIIGHKTITKRRPKRNGSVSVKAEECKKRMLEWPNPVEFVNNLYGAHPGEDNTEYFKVVFGKRI